MIDSSLADIKIKNQKISAKEIICGSGMKEDSKGEDSKGEESYS